MGRIAANETLKGFNCTLHFAKTIFSPNQNHLSVLSVVVAFALEARKANQQWFSNAKHWRALSDQPAGDYFIRFDKKMKRKFRNIKAKKREKMISNEPARWLLVRYLIAILFFSALSKLLCSNSFSADWELNHPLEFHRNPFVSIIPTRAQRKGSSCRRQDRKEAKRSRHKQRWRRLCQRRSR